MGETQPSAAAAAADLQDDRPTSSGFARAKRQGAREGRRKANR